MRNIIHLDMSAYSSGGSMRKKIFSLALMSSIALAVYVLFALLLHVPNNIATLLAALFGAPFVLIGFWYKYDMTFTTYLFWVFRHAFRSPRLYFELDCESPSLFDERRTGIVFVGKKTKAQRQESD